MGSLICASTANSVVCSQIHFAITVYIPWIDTRPIWWSRFDESMLGRNLFETCKQTVLLLLRLSSKSSTESVHAVFLQLCTAPATLLQRLLEVLRSDFCGSRGRHVRRWPAGFVRAGCCRNLTVFPELAQPRFHTSWFSSALIGEFTVCVVCDLFKFDFAVLEKQSNSLRKWYFKRHSCGY